MIPEVPSSERLSLGVRNGNVLLENSGLVYLQWDATIFVVMSVRWLRLIRFVDSCLLEHSDAFSLVRSVFEDAYKATRQIEER